MRKLFKLLIVSFAFFADAHADCAFCRDEVIKKQCVYENESLQILVDYAPVVKGHLLIIPKRHVSKAHELSIKEWTALSDAVGKAAEVFQKVLHTDQYIILEKNGPFAGQTVFHVHFHLLPFPTEKISDEMKKIVFARVLDKSPERLSDSELTEVLALYKQAFTETLSIPISY